MTSLPARRNVQRPEQLSVNRLFIENGTAPDSPPLVIQPSAAPTGALEKGAIWFDSTSNTLQAYDGTASGAVGAKLVLSKQWVATSVDENIFIADRAYTVTGVKAVPTIAGTDASAVTLDIKKCTGTQAPSGGTTILNATVDLKGTINTVVAPALTATTATLSLAAGDRLAADFTGTLTAAVGNYEIYLSPA